MKELLTFLAKSLVDYPDEVTVTEVEKDNALVLQMICDINGYEDKESVQKARTALNMSVLGIADKMRKDDTLFLNIDKVNIETDNKLTSKEIVKEYNKVKGMI